MAEDVVSWKNPNGGGAATTQILVGPEFGLYFYRKTFRIQ